MKLAGTTHSWEQERYKNISKCIERKLIYCDPSPLQLTLPILSTQPSPSRSSACGYNNFKYAYF